MTSINTLLEIDAALWETGDHKEIFKKWFELSKSKAISFADFDAFMKKSSSKVSTPASTVPVEESKKLAQLPSDCPRLPDGCE